MKIGVEIGVGDIKSSFLLKNKEIFDKIILCEPNNIFYNELESIKDNKVKIYNEAIGREKKIDIFYTIGQSSFLKGAKSFLNLAHDEAPEEYLIKFSKEKKVVPLVEIEDKKIDFLNLTCNGSEMEVLYGTAIKPTVIRTVLMIHNERHGQYAGQLFSFLSQNGYRIIKQNTNKLNTYLETYFKHE